MARKRDTKKIKYVAVAITEELYEGLRRYVEGSNERYVSMTEVARKAIVDFLKARRM